MHKLVANSSECLVIPILLTIEPEEHRRCIHSRFVNQCSQQEIDQKLNEYQQVQQYLLNQATKCGFHQVPINPQNFNETTEIIHDIFIKSLER